MLDRSIRDIERERQGLQNQEKKLITEIKKTAKQGQMVKYHFFCLIFVYLIFLSFQNHIFANLMHEREIDHHNMSCHFQSTYT